MERVFDIEANGFLDVMTKVHCIVTEEVSGDQAIHAYDPSELSEGLTHLENTETLVGHNIIDYDLPALKKIFSDFNFNGKIVDTLVMSRVAYPNLKELDFNLIKRQAKNKNRDECFPARLVGRHGLEAWGYRLKFNKGEYGKQDDAWDTYSPEMLEYCKQDVALNKKLYIHLKNAGVPSHVFKMEQDCFEICREQKKHGFPFDVSKAVQLHRTLLQQKQLLVASITQELGGPFIYKLEEKTPARTIRYKNPLQADRFKGASYTSIKVQEFNANSRVHIGKRLVSRLNWKAPEFTTEGYPAVSEETLKTLKHPLGKTLDEYFMIEKRLGMLADGRYGWLRLVEDDGAIHGSVNTMGAGTSRCTHSKPNMAQIPSVNVPYGKECRELFHAPEGWKLFGTDASGLELRMLAHYMSRWDGGAYGKIILEGDIHTANQEAAGLPTRNNAKTFIYAFLYGAGDGKIGSIVNGSRAKGASLKNKFFRKTPAIKALLDAVQSVAKKQGYVKGLDGRKIPVRSAHSALNFLLQGAGAIVCKLWMVNMHKLMKDLGYVSGRDYKQVAFVHDELQWLFREDVLDIFTLHAVSSDAMDLTREQLGIRIQLDTDSNLGDNYAETH